MSRGSNQKFKFTYLMRIMLEKTDDEHAMTKQSEINSDRYIRERTADRWNLILRGSAKTEPV